MPKVKMTDVIFKNWRREVCDSLADALRNEYVTTLGISSNKNDFGEWEIHFPAASINLDRAKEFIKGFLACHERK